MKTLNFRASPTCAKFMKSDSFGRLIAGPVGSGKTTAVIWELFRRACEQAPAPDGFRYTRFAIVRQTLKQLKDTVLRDIMSIFGEVANYKVSDQTIYFNIGDVRSEWLLIPLETPEDQRRLLSMQLSMAWMSEAAEMNVEIISPLAGRCGRYPGPALGGCTFFGVVADTNMPSEGSPWHKFMTEPPPDWAMYFQPGGMDEDAENLDWLTQTPETLKLPIGHPDRRAQGRTYYERFLRSNTSDWCQRYVHAKFGDDPSGTAVFGHSFKRSFHVADNVEPVHGHVLIVGLDFGRDPCAIISQVDHRGRLLVLEEIMGEDIGLEIQIAQRIRPTLMQERYLGRAVAIIGDPAGGQRSTIYEETTFDFLKRHGFQAFPAPTNDIAARLRAVDALLMGQVDGGPMMLIDGQRCPTLIRALNGGYRYGKTRLGQRKPVPDKNEYSHVADALQYACLSAHGGMTTMITGKIMGRAKQRPRSNMSASAWT